MARTAKPEPLTGDAVVRRTPRILRYLADIMDAEAAGDEAYVLEAPSDLPMDEATFVATIYAMGELADAAAMDAAAVRDYATLIETQLDAAQSSPAAPPAEAPAETADPETCDHPAVAPEANGVFTCVMCGTVVP